MQRINREESFRAKEERLKDLFVRGLSGNNAAYQTFLGELSSYLRAFLRKRLIRLPDEVEDLVQEALLAVHNQRHTYDPSQPLSAWVQAIARYKLVDMLRRQGRSGCANSPRNGRPSTKRGGSMPAIAAKVSATLEETSALLEAVHSLGISPATISAAGNHLQERSLT